MVDCENLLTSFGDRFRVWNETQGHKAHQPDDPWDLVLPGATGFVAPWGGRLLVACTNSRHTTKRLLADVPGAVIVQDGSDGQNATFDVAHLDTVASILRLRKRRRLSEAQRAALVAAGQASRFESRGTERSEEAPCHDVAEIDP